MEQTPPPPATSTAYPHSHPLRPLHTPKLRLMCSYGGHIVPRPHDKSLCYVSGDTRVVAFDRRTTASTLSVFTTHLSRTLYKNRPFTLKYRLPNEDLESLISVTTDEDLHNMLEEHDRIENSSPPTPARIRLFLFPSKPDQVGSGLLGPKSESWFCDALKSIVRRGESGDLGMGNELMGLDCMGGPDSYLEAPVESLSRTTTGGEVKLGFDLGSLPESMGWDKSSSLGSTNSSNSTSSLPTIGIHGEDSGVIFQDKKVKLVSSSSNESDNSVASAVSYPKTEICQDQVLCTTSLDTKVSSNKVESEIVSDKTSMIQQQKTIQVPGYQLSHQSDWKQHQQEVQYINAGGHCTPQSTTKGMIPISSYLPVYHPPQPQQQQQHPYQPSQPYPMHLLPIRTTQSYQMSVPCSVSDTVIVASSRPNLQALACLITPRVTYKEVPAAPAISITPRLAYKEVPPAPSIPITPRLAYKEVPTPPAIRELAAEVYRKIPVATPVPLDSALSHQNHQHFMAPSEMFHQTPSVATTAMATSSYNVNDDIACTQIYKTQPPAPPALPRIKPRQR